MTLKVANERKFHFVIAVVPYIDS